jgi:hypothetical protein
MSVILSFLRKDLRLLLWPWLVWLSLLPARIALGFWCIRKTHFSGADSTNAMRIDLALTVLGALTCYLLVLRLVQADAPLRPRAFWHTRPISGGGLLLAKALAALLLFGLAPVLVSLPWWLANGLGGADLALAALEVLLAHVAIILPAFLIASVVDSFGRAVLWSVVQFGLLVGLAIFAGQSLDNQSRIGPGLALSRDLLAASLATLGLVALVVWQFRRRRQVAVIAAFVLLHVAVAVVWRYSPCNFIPSPAAWTELNAERYKNVSLQPNVAAEYYHFEYLGSKPEPAFVHLQWPVTGLAPDLIASADLMALSYNNDSPTTPIALNDAFARAGGIAPSRQNLRNLLGLPPMKTPDGDTPTQSQSITIDHQLSLTQAEAIKRHPPSTTTTLRLDLYRPEILQNHPLRTGLKFTDRHGSIRILGVDETQPAIQIEGSSTQPFSLLRFYVKKRCLDRQNSPCHDSRGESFTEDYLFDPASSSEIGMDRMKYRSELLILGIEIGRLKMDYSPFRPDGKYALPLGMFLDTWCAGFRFVRIAYHEEARFSLTGRADAVVFTGSPEAPPAKL